jgi:hypothetical protein
MLVYVGNDVVMLVYVGNDITMIVYVGNNITMLVYVGYDLVILVYVGKKACIRLNRRYFKNIQMRFNWEKQNYIRPNSFSSKVYTYKHKHANIIRIKSYSQEND